MAIFKPTAIINPFTGQLDMAMTQNSSTLVLPNYSSVTTVGNVGATETDLYNINFAANYQNFNTSTTGQRIVIEAGGNFLQATGTDHRRIAVYVGGASGVRGTLCFNSGFMNIGASAHWSLKVSIMNASAGGVGILRVATDLFCQGISGGAHTTHVVNDYVVVNPVTFTSAWSFFLTAQSDGVTANNQTTADWIKSVYYA